MEEIIRCQPHLREELEAFMNTTAYKENKEFIEEENRQRYEKNKYKFVCGIPIKEI